MFSDVLVHGQHFTCLITASSGLAFDMQSQDQEQSACLLSSSLWANRLGGEDSTADEAAETPVQISCQHILAYNQFHSIPPLSPALLVETSLNNLK